MKVRITLPEMQKALARVKPREGITFVELEAAKLTNVIPCKSRQLHSPFSYF